MMVFVQRTDGNITGVYANKQPGYAEEVLANDNAEVLAYLNPPSGVPDRVTARQFKLQLLASGLLDDVETWVTGQSQAVQIAYENSGTFVRNEPMMESGFAGLGFTSAQIDTFFAAAAEL